MISKIAFKRKNSILILIRSINNCKLIIIVQLKSAKPLLYVIVLCLNMEIEPLNNNIGRWETTWFDCHILHFKCFNLVAYDLYRHFHVIWVNGSTLEAQEWHFCNFELQNDTFVNIVARCNGTTIIRSLFHASAVYFFFSVLSNLHFCSRCFSGCSSRCSTRFLCFCTSFCHFCAHLTEPIVGFTFWMHLVDWVAHFVDFVDLKQHPLMGFSSFIW